MKIIKTISHRYSVWHAQGVQKDHSPLAGIWLFDKSFASIEEAEKYANELAQDRAIVRIADNEADDDDE